MEPLSLATQSCYKEFFKSTGERVIYFYYLKYENIRSLSNTQKRKIPLKETKIGGVESFATSQEWNWNPGRVGEVR